MRKPAVSLPDAFSLLKSEFNDFLFAPVGGDEDDRRTLTVLSALTRAGIDPWQHAARLRQLPRESAVGALASIFATLRDQPLSSTEAEHAAERLIGLLPRRPSRRARFAARAAGMRDALARLIAR
jgi:hypothetical protein